MKRSTPYLIFGGLILLILTLLALAPSSQGQVVALEEVIITATLGPTLAASEDENGMVYMDDLNPAQAATATLGPTLAATEDEDGVTYIDDLNSAQAIDGGVGAQAATPTRTPTPINIGNFVWDDLDGDGIQDAGEPGMSGVTVQLWNSTKTALIDSAVTSASGTYSVIAPLPGTYRIRVLLPNVNDAFSPKDTGSDDLKDSDINPSGGDKGFSDTFTLASNVISITKMDAGIMRYKTPTPTRTPTPINVGNFVWDDLDGDGIQDAGEPGMSGVTVQLWNSAKTQLIHQTVTNASGVYTLVAPTPGNYRVRALLPNNNDQFSPKNAGADDLKDSDINTGAPDNGFTDIYTFPSNLISITTIDIGIIRYKTPTPTRTPTPINVGNLVWHDLNGNGLQDAGEPGLSGITVQLWNEAKTQLFDQTITNASGVYTLVAPTPGNYRVRVVPFTAGDLFTAKDAGADDLKDSDINPSGVNAGFTDTYVFGSNLISITSIDAGMSFVQLTPTPSATPTATPTVSAPNAAPIRNYDTDAVIHFTWVSVDWAVGYELEVDNNSNFSSPEYTNRTIARNQEGLWVLLPFGDRVLYWRVGAKAANNTVHWSAAQTITINTP